MSQAHKRLRGKAEITAHCLFSILDLVLKSKYESRGFIQSSRIRAKQAEIIAQKEKGHVHALHSLGSGRTCTLQNKRSDA